MSLTAKRSANNELYMPLEISPQMILKKSKISKEPGNPFVHSLFQKSIIMERFINLSLYAKLNCKRV